MKFGEPTFPPARCVYAHFVIAERQPQKRGLFVNKNKSRMKGRIHEYEK